MPIYNPAELVSTFQVVPLAAPLTSSSSSSNDLTIRLHPVVVMNFFNHHSSLMEGALSEATMAVQQQRMFGCVIGVQRGQTVEIFNSFELVLDPVTGTLDRAFLKKKQEQYKKVFPDFDVLGWYSIGSAVQDSDLQIHKAFMDLDKHPVYLLLNPAFDLCQKDLPVTIYESELCVINDSVELHFVKSKYTIETVEAEKISTDHGLKPSSMSSSRAASTEESAEQDHRLLKLSCIQKSTLATSEMGLQSSYREDSKPFRKVLLETPSGFSMFDVSEMVLRRPENIWIWFTRISAARKAIYNLGFVKVDKSVAWDSDVGPGKDLEEFILKFCNNKQIIVPDLQLKAVIERNLKVECWFEKEIVHELMWGLNYALAAFVPGEKGYPVNERPLSKHLERKIKIHRLNVSLQKIDREFIDMLGYLAELQFGSKVIPKFLHRKFDRWVHVTTKTTDIDFAKDVAALLSSPETPVAEILGDSQLSKEDVLRYIEEFLANRERRNYAMAYFERREEATSTEVDQQGTATEVDCGNHKIQRLEVDLQRTATQVDCGNHKIQRLGIVGFLEQHWIKLFGFGITIAAVLLSDKGETHQVEKIEWTSLPTDVI